MGNYKYFLVLIVLLISPCVLWADQNIYTVRVVKPFHRQVPWEIDLGSNNQVEMKLMTQWEFIFIEVFVNQQGPFRFLLDTGADTSIISQDLVNKLKLTPLEKRKRIFETAHKKAEVDSFLYIIDELKLNSAIIKHAPFIATNTATDDFELLRDLNIFGILGTNLFHDLVMTVDFPQQKFILSQHAKNRRSKENVLKVIEQYYVPVVKIKVIKNQEEFEYDFLIDTGYNGYVKMPICFAYQANRGQEDAIMTYDVLNDAQGGFIAELGGDFILGTQKIENPKVKYTLGACETQQRWGLIGTRFLKPYSLSIDQRNREVIIH